LVTVWGYVVMPESLTPERRDPKITPRKLNPFVQLYSAFNLPQLRLILIATFLWTVIFSVLQANLGALAKDQFGAGPDDISFVLFVIGTVVTLMQGVIVPRLVKRFTEAQLTIAGLFLLTIGFVFIAVTAALDFVPLLLVAVLFTGAGNGLIIPAISGLTSQAVSMREQGRVQGGSQSVQALARVIGPLWAGWSYVALGHPAPYLSGALVLFGTAFVVMAAVPTINAQKARMMQTASVAAYKGED
jgi:DHA1 family tetracycline resistance protein-like MFS transporter